MKCPEYVPAYNDPKHCAEYAAAMKDQISDCPYRYECVYGWLPFWTPAERAGIKAMGRQYRNKKHAWLRPYFDVGVVVAIQVYVRAARAAKGAK